MFQDDRERLREAGIRPSAQRLAVAAFVLHSDRHPSAEQVFEAVKPRLPVLSRATVYNTLKLFVARGLLRQLSLAEGHSVFDPRTESHHHFIDEDSGAIIDLPWQALRVADIDALEGFEVREYQVVLRGTRRKAASENQPALHRRER